MNLTQCVIGPRKCTCRMTSESVERFKQGAHKCDKRQITDRQTTLIITIIIIIIISSSSNGVDGFKLLSPFPGLGAWCPIAERPLVHFEVKKVTHFHGIRHKQTFIGPKHGKCRHSDIALHAFISYLAKLYSEFFLFRNGSSKRPRNHPHVWCV